MRSYRLLTTLLLTLSVSAAPTLALAKDRPASPAGSFLLHQARSVRQLVQEVQSDSVARRRLARYFHQPEGTVGDFLGRNLRAGALPSAGQYTVFFVTGSGLVYPTRMALRPGTPVFVARNGKPLLLQGTGNPIKPFRTAIEVMTVLSSPTVSVGGTREEIVTTAPVDIPVPVAPVTPQP